MSHDPQNIQKNEIDFPDSVSGDVTIPEINYRYYLDEAEYQRIRSEFLLLPEHTELQLKLRSVAANLRDGEWIE